MKLTFERCELNIRIRVEPGWLSIASRVGQSNNQGFDFASFSGHLPRFDPLSPRKIEKCPVAPFLPRIENFTVLFDIIRYFAFCVCVIIFMYQSPYLVISR